MLVRETGTAVIACFALEAWLSGARRRSWQLLALSFIPPLAWRLYVGWILFADWGWTGFWYNPTLARPLVGILDLWSTIRRGAYFPGLTTAAIWYSVLLIGGAAAALTLALKRPRALALAGVVYGILAISLPYAGVWGHVGNAQRATYELFVILALMSVDLSKYTIGVQRGIAAFWVGTGLFVFVGAFDADSIREAVFGLLS